MRGKIALILMLVTALSVVSFGAMERASAQVDTCLGLPESRLTSGALARVVGRSSLKEGAPNGVALKTGPNRDGLVLRYAAPGSILKIDDNSQPSCTVDGDRWWAATIGDLKGFVVETVGQNYVLEPFTGAPPTPAPSIPTKPLICIQPRLETPAPTPTAPPNAEPIVRVLFGADDGTLQFSDNGGLPRVAAQFEFAPLSVDLSPDGTAAAVLTPNGLYWVELLTGNTLYLADPTRFNLSEQMWFTSVQWAPDGNSIALGIEDTRDGIYTYPMWDVSVDGVSAPYQVDTGKEPKDPLRRAPNGSTLLLLSANDIVPYPLNFADEPVPLLEFTPFGAEGDGRSIRVPAVTWAADSSGFYTYIPKSPETPPDDPIAGRLWFIPLEGEPKELAVPKDVPSGAQIIPLPSHEGAMMLQGEAASWQIRNAEGKIADLPPLSRIFGWTPDNQGVAFVDAEGRAGYLGLDGSTESAYVPQLENLFTLRWLRDGSQVYAVRGTDQKLTLSVQLKGAAPAYMGIINSPSAYAAGVFNAPPGLGKTPQPCQ